MFYVHRVFWCHVFALLLIVVSVNSCCANLAKKGDFIPGING